MINTEENEPRPKCKCEVTTYLNNEVLFSVCVLTKNMTHNDPFITKNNNNKVAEKAL